MNNIEELLKKKSFDVVNATKDISFLNKVIKLSDALEICKGLYTKEQVEELAKGKEIEIRSMVLSLVALKASKNWKQLDNLIEQLNEIYKLDQFEEKP